MASPNYPYGPASGFYYGAPPYGPSAYPPEAQSIAELFTAAKIVAIIIAIFEIIGFLFGVVIWLLGFGFGWFGVFVLAGAVVNLAFFIEVGAMQDLVASGQYQSAKQKALVWVILGFIFGWIVVGAIVLAAYLKFDGVIYRQRAWASPGWPGQPASAGFPGYPAFPPGAGWIAPQPAAPGPPAPAAGSTVAAPPAAAFTPSGTGIPPMVLCPRCGRPPSWVPGFNRWYCYFDGLYL